MNDPEPLTPEQPLDPPEGTEHSSDRAEAHKLRRGRWLGQLQVHYQPIIDIRDGSLAGMEALLRWHHPDRGTLPAGNFVPLAERAGMTGRLDEEVLRTAAAFRRRRDIDAAARFRVTVNVVAADLVQPGVLEGIRKTLDETRLEAELLQLDVSNLGGVDDRTALKSALEELYRCQIALSLDDFEAASASTHVLAELPFRTVKVDFNEARTPEAIQAMIAAVNVAQERRLRVVAKRVETADHLRLLRTLDIDGAQGYALGPPVRALEFEGLLEDARLLTESPVADVGYADAA